MLYVFFIYAFRFSLSLSLVSICYLSVSLCVLCLFPLIDESTPTVLLRLLVFASFYSSSSACLYFSLRSLSFCVAYRIHPALVSLLLLFVVVFEALVIVSYRIISCVQCNTPSLCIFCSLCHFFGAFGSFWFVLLSTYQFLCDLQAEFRADGKILLVCFLQAYIQTSVDLLRAQVRLRAER